jgi:hypothetical protein
VGVAAGLPNPRQGRDVRLGDVLVCVPDKAGSGIVQYDLDRGTDAGFLTNGQQAETPAIVRAAIGSMQLTKKKSYKERHEFARLLNAFLQADEDEKFRCPSQDTAAINDFGRLGRPAYDDCTRASRRYWPGRGSGTVTLALVTR